MRRLIASFLAGVAVFAACVAWTSLAATATVLDPSRTERVAEVLTHDRAVRAAVEDALAQALVAAVPVSAPVSIDEVKAAAHRALDDPRALEVMRVAIVEAHRRLVGETHGSLQVDAGPIAIAGRDALLAAHPELARTLPTPPPLAVELPTESLPDLGGLKDAAGGVPQKAAQAAAVLFAAALLVAADRPRVLRRAGLFAVWAAGAWVALGWLVPWAVSHWSVDGGLAVLGSLSVAVARPMMLPAAALLAAGAAVLVAASAWARNRSARSKVPAAGPTPGGPVWQPATVQRLTPTASPPAVPVSHPAKRVDAGSGL
jgi:hypothetical protein